MELSLSDKLIFTRFLVGIPRASGGFKSEDQYMVTKLLDADEDIFLQFRDYHKIKALELAKLMATEKKMELSRLLYEFLTRNREVVNSELEAVRAILNQIELDSSEWDSALIAIVVAHRFKQSLLGR